jgi:hypothetical protein
MYVCDLFDHTAEWGSLTIPQYLQVHHVAHNTRLRTEYTIKERRLNTDLAYSTVIFRIIPGLGAWGGGGGQEEQILVPTVVVILMHAFVHKYLHTST